jgi:hypothetical protein
MGAQENWLSNLRAIIDREAPALEKRAGYRAVSLATGMTEEYIYQLYSGAKKSDGSRRRMGPKMAKRLAQAFAEGRPLDWIDHAPPTVGIAAIVAEPPARYGDDAEPALALLDRLLRQQSRQERLLVGDAFQRYVHTLNPSLRRALLELLKPPKEHS